MKKGIVALLIVLALLVLVSPGLIGMLAERSVDEQIERASNENSDVRITPESFDRGWFSSQGRHRIELLDGSGATNLRGLLGLGFQDALPALIIDTDLKHGLIPLGSAGDEHGSLAPGLGNAESRLSLETPDGEIVPLPGKVYSSLGLTGNLKSTYVAEAGSSAAARWGDVNVTMESSVTNRALSYDGLISSLAMDSGQESIDLENLAFSGDLEMSKFNFTVGDVRVDAERLTVMRAGQPPIVIAPFSFETHSGIDGDRVDSNSVLSMSLTDVPGVGEMGIDLVVAADGVDGESLGRLLRRAQSLQSGSNAVDLLSAVEPELLDVLAAGADIRLERLDIRLPEGTLKTVMNLKLDERDRDDFAWTSLALSTEADARMEVPETLANLMMMMAPQGDALRGFLVRNGDIYEVEAAYKKGLLTVNGVPLPVPIR